MKSMDTLKKDEIRRLLNLAMREAVALSGKARQQAHADAMAAIQNYLITRARGLPVSKAQQRDVSFYADSRTGYVNFTFSGIKIPKRLLDRYAAATTNIPLQMPSELRVELALHELSGIDPKRLATAIDVVVKKLLA